MIKLKSFKMESMKFNFVWKKELNLKGSIVMSRRKKDEFDYSFKRTGAFGVFKSNGSMPAEYLMTTFTIEEIPNLSLARDINSSLNFDYLIQRDIDQERALSEISRYITSVDGATQKEIVFLPPPTMPSVVLNTLII